MQSLAMRMIMSWRWREKSEIKMHSQGIVLYDRQQYNHVVWYNNTKVNYLLKFQLIKGGINHNV